MPERLDKDPLSIGGGRSIPADELAIKASRAGGPGGQHVNTSSTKVEVSWNIRETRLFTVDERERVLAKLASRIDGNGALRVVASDTRSQRQNRELAEARMAEAVRKALVVPRSRKATKPSRGAKRARLDEKKRESRKKADRRARDWD